MELNSLQLTIIDVLKNSKLKDIFYWTGGTLLSHYYLKHRISLDLDFFSPDSFSYNDILPFISALKEKIRGNIEENKIDDRWDFIIKKDDGSAARVEFVHYNHGKIRLMPLQKYMGVLIDSLDDIAANKVMAYFDRNEPKDLFDIYFLMTKKGYQVDKLLEMVNKKFGASFSQFMFWSESAKSVNLLDSLKPLLLDSDLGKQSELFAQVRSFFLENGSRYLATKLE